MYSNCNEQKESTEKAQKTRFFGNPACVLFSQSEPTRLAVCTTTRTLSSSYTNTIILDTNKYTFSYIYIYIYLHFNHLPNEKTSHRKYFVTFFWSFPEAFFPQKDIYFPCWSHYKITYSYFWRYSFLLHFWYMSHFLP